MKNATIFQRFIKAIKSHRLLNVGDRVIVAVSGGADSVALLDLLLAIQKPYLLDLIVAHLNHNLRGEQSDADAEFVRLLAEHHQLRFVSKKIPDEETSARRDNLEDWARRWRYEFLCECAEGHLAQRVAMGHTMNDQAETLLMRLIRGSGTLGLGAMPPKRNDLFIRPLLYVERREIQSYLVARGLTWREDSTNQDARLLRNRLRHELLVELRDRYNPRIVQALSSAAEILREDAEVIQSYTAALFAQNSHFDGHRVVWEARRLLSYPVGLQKNLIRHSLLQLREVAGSSTVGSILSLLQNGKSGKVFETATVRCRREFRTLILERPEPFPFEAKYRYALGIPSDVQVAQTGTRFLASLDPVAVSEQTLNRWEFSLDRAALGRGFLIRNCEPGDTYWVPGSHSSLRVSQWLARRKVPKGLRLTWPVITLDGKIICVKDFPFSTDTVVRDQGGGDSVRVIVEERKVG
jgi:tRNA(Ile)-lysidine synthase